MIDNYCRSLCGLSGNDTESNLIYKAWKTILVIRADMAKIKVLEIVKMLTTFTKNSIILSGVSIDCCCLNSILKYNKICLLFDNQMLIT